MKTLLNTLLSLCIILTYTDAFSKTTIKNTRKIKPPTWNPTFTSPQRSLIDSGTHSIVMTIVSDGIGNIYIFDTTYNAMSSDRSSLFAFDASSWDSTHFTLPNNAHTYWWIPFDTTYRPLSLGSGGGSGGVNCRCHLAEVGGSGGCYPVQPCFTAPCWRCENPNTGCTSCELIGGWNPNPSLILRSGVVIDAVTINFKGHQYQ